MERNYIIFAPEESIQEDEIEYHEVIDWGIRNLTHENVLSLSQDDVYFLQYKTKVLDIINEENKGILQVGEDDWVIGEDIKKRILERLSAVLLLSQSEKERFILGRIIDILKTAIETRKYMYFIF